MFTISKEFSFAASHQLSGLREGHQCGRLHGHNYTVEVVLRSYGLNEHSFVVDYGDLGAFRQMLDRDFEHRNLNDAVDFQPSAENLAQYFYSWCRQRWPETYAVRVKETDKTCAEYCPAQGLEFGVVEMVQDFVRSQAGASLILTVILRNVARLRSALLAEPAQ